jgi:hypothetical protein
MRNICFFLLLWQGMAGYIAAQQSVKGVVVTEDKKGRIKPVPFANVYWMNTNYGTSTDSAGTFQLAVPENPTSIVVSYVGFTSDTLNPENFDEPLTVNLKQSVALKAVEVEYRRKTTEMSFINPLKTENISERELFKAACCNLSESFETNPSVDVNFTDAVTGTRQIQMLGLDGPYTMLSRENMPGIRGLGNAFGLTFIPGSWISSIQVTKGVGSVVNGYESIAGQINTELKKPEEGEQFFFNAYANQAGRTEVNLVKSWQVSENWGTTALLHANMRPWERDQNQDGFMDFPQQEQLNFMNRWKYDSHKSLRGQLGLHLVKDSKSGGQKEEVRDELGLNPAGPPAWTLDIETERAELFGKVGYLFPAYKYRSMGVQASALYHHQYSRYGLRDYEAEERSFYVNYIYQSIIGNTFHKFKTGFSFMYDEYEERVEDRPFDRLEKVPGAFFEYTYEPTANITLVAGLRGDLHNIFGAFVTPRLHFRWATDEKTVWRLLAGSGQRTANIFAENQSLFATSRTFYLLATDTDLPFGLQQEKAWNFGFNVTRDFRLDYRDGYVSLDLYRTDFEQQVVIDRDQNAREVYFYNLRGDSYSNSAQIEVSYELLKFLNLRTAYRWLEVRTDYLSGELQKPLVPKHRFFANLGYETAKSLNNANWAFDFTWQWIGEQRIPAVPANSNTENGLVWSPAFSLFNTQVTRNFNKQWAVYAGLENILDYRQENPIIDAANPFGNNLDASLVWGPIFGRMVYAGVRFKLEE